MKIIQFIFLRNNIPGIKKGGLVAQACHAAIAAIFTNRKNIDTIEYLKDLENMTKIVLKVSFYLIRLVTNN